MYEVLNKMPYSIGMVVDKQGVIRILSKESLKVELTDANYDHAVSMRNRGLIDLNPIAEVTTKPTEAKELKTDKKEK